MRNNIDVFSSTQRDRILANNEAEEEEEEDEDDEGEERKESVFGSVSQRLVDAVREDQVRGDGNMAASGSVAQSNSAPISTRCSPNRSRNTMQYSLLADDEEEEEEDKDDDDDDDKEEEEEEEAEDDDGDGSVQIVSNRRPV